MYIAYTIYIYTYILKLLNSLMSISLQCGLIKNRQACCKKSETLFFILTFKSENLNYEGVVIYNVTIEGSDKTS